VAYVAVAVATCYSHLWTFALLAGHGVFIGFEALRPASARPGFERLASASTALTAAVAFGVLAYTPLIAEIVAMGTDRVSGVMFARLIEGVLQMIRYGSWSVAAYVVLVPVLLEGLARRTDRPWDDRRVRFHVTVVVSVLGFAVLANPLNFGSRFLLEIAPSVFALAAWALGGYWDGSGACPRLPLLPTAATCLIGFALGVFIANAPLAHEIPPRSNAEIKED
jgi:hypothetical protein